jgi:hypothetical protein
MGRGLGEALSAQLDGPPDALWLFCAPEKGLNDLLRGVNEATGGRHLVGCTTDGEIRDGEVLTGSVVVGGIRSDRIDFTVAIAERIGEDSERAGRDIALGLPRSIRYIQLFSDGLTGNGSAMLRGISSVLGTHIPVSGGTAGDMGRFVRTWQFAGRRVMTDAAVAIGFSGDVRVGTGVGSGWAPIGLAKTVTRVEGNVLYELNGKPALEVYERFLGQHACNLPQVGVEYPLMIVGGPGLPEGDAGCMLLRATMSVDRKKGAIAFAGDIAEGATVHLTCGDRDAIQEAAGAAARTALDGLGDVQPAMIFSYSCMARKIVLGRHTAEELQRIRAVVGESVPMIGFYTYGEYCRAGADGPSFLHNETATVSILGG